MATFEQEKYFFTLFVGELNQADLPSGEKKLINIILGHFDAIAGLGTAGGKRADKFSQLVQSDWKTTTDVISVSEVAVEQSKSTWRQLHDIVIEDFRGFSKAERIDLSKKYTFVYGPNGSGKSSFFEALEYCLIGDIQEALSRRQSVAQYIKNLQTGKGKAPILRAKDEKGDLIEISPSRPNHQFCLVEKNRIDGFARISSQTKEKQTNLLATLFGLDTFNKFVEEFTENIEKRVFIEGEKAKELRAKETAVMGSRENKQKAEETLSNIQREKKELIQLAELGTTFEDLVQYINGDQNSRGKIKELENELEQPTKLRIEIDSVEELSHRVTSLAEDCRRYAQKNKSLLSQREKDSYLVLYQAVTSLQPVSIDRCPACQTPIKRSLLGWKETKVNPFEIARRGIQELESLSLLRAEIQKLHTDLRTTALGLEEKLEEYGSAKSQLNLSFDLPHLEKSQLTVEADDEVLVNTIERLTSYGSTHAGSLRSISQEVQKHNEQTESIDKHRDGLRLEKERLRGFQTKMTVLQTRENETSRLFENAEAAIETFNSENTQLLKDVEEEKPKIEFNKQFVTAYRSFIPKLTRFKNELPTRWVKDLNLLVKEIYNLINLNDAKSELIEEIKLPEKAEDKIQIAFQDNPEHFIDALYILSEGHIRCLGLSVLLAKNIAEKKSIVILDDIVNAIDDDHRAGIRRVLFEYDKLKDKQVVLTSHSEEFIKDTENDIAATDYDKLVKKIIFLRPSNRQLHQLENDSFNYLKKAEESLNKNVKRDSLANCRRALENIAQVLWKKLDKDINSTIKVSVRRPGERPELMTIVNGVTSLLSMKGTHLKYFKGLASLEYLKGLETKSSVIWNLLNAGTHEEIDRDDFDIEIVREIHGKLIELDTLLKT